MEFSGPSAYWMGNNEPKKDYVPTLFMCIICVLKLVCCPQATKIVTLLRLFVEEVTTRDFEPKRHELRGNSMFEKNM